MFTPCKPKSKLNDLVSYHIKTYVCIYKYLHIWYMYIYVSINKCMSVYSISTYVAMLTRISNRDPKTKFC